MARKLEERGVYNQWMWHIWPESQLGDNWFIHIETSTPPVNMIDLLVTTQTDIEALRVEYATKYPGLIQKLLRMVIERQPQI